MFFQVFNHFMCGTSLFTIDNILKHFRKMMFRHFHLMRELYAVFKNFKRVKFFKHS